MGWGAVTQVAALFLLREERNLQYKYNTRQWRCLVAAGCDVFELEGW